MPTYSYACTACEHQFDTVQKFTDSSLTDCPECSGRLRKLFSSVGIVFKGSGFYRNDSRAGSGAGSDPNGKPEPGSNGKSKPGSEAASTSSRPTSSGTASESKSGPASTPSSPSSTAASS